jgi:hypothetical protein
LRIFLIDEDFLDDNILQLFNQLRFFRQDDLIDALPFYHAFLHWSRRGSRTGQLSSAVQTQRPAAPALEQQFDPPAVNELIRAAPTTGPFCR